MTIKLEGEFISFAAVSITALYGWRRRLRNITSTMTDRNRRFHELAPTRLYRPSKVLHITAQSGERRPGSLLRPEDVALIIAAAEVELRLSQYYIKKMAMSAAIAAVRR